jgi:ATP-dependent DNA ligase
MLARLVRELPRGEFVFEPKWDGFRCLASREAGHVELLSRNERPLSRYFPELVRAFSSVDAEPWTIDGEVLLALDGQFDFEALMGRLHPASSRVRELAERAPALFVAFDLLRADGESWCAAGFRRRRRRLEALFSGARPPLYLTPATEDRALAETWLTEFCGGGLDGVVAKPAEGAYEPGARAMLKVKHERTADCIVAGLRAAAADDAVEVSSLLLGLVDASGRLEHIGVASSFGRGRRRALTRELAPLVTDLDGHPWQQGFLHGGGATGRLKGAAGRWIPGMTLDWVPLRIERVAEVSYTQVDGHRLRHPARFVRWRPDRAPDSCSIDQLALTPAPIAQVLSS